MNRYFEDMVLSASPAELIRLLYQKAIDSTRKAREHLRNGRIAERAAAIGNVYAILSELTASLKPEEAPELAARLSALYAYLQGRLLEANLKQIDQPLADVLSVLGTLAEPWSTLAGGPPAPAVPAAPWNAATGDPAAAGARYAMSA